MIDWGFWSAAGGMSLVVTASLIAALFQRRQAEQPASAYDVQVYRAQLAEVDREVASGVMAGAEADRLRAEISRRILEADRLGRGGAVAASTGARGVAAVAIAAVMVAALWGYLRLGAPGYPDMPLAERLAVAETYLADRPSQASAEAAAPKLQAATPDPEMADLMAKLRKAVADRPGDVTGLRLLVNNEAAIGNLAAARTALVALMKLAASDQSADHAGLADLMIRLAGGYVSPEAEAELVRALKLDPKNGIALFYSGLMFAQADRADRAFVLWRDLLDVSAPDDPWVAPIRARIEDMADRAGVRYTLPDAAVPLPDAAGPTAAQIGAATDMTPDQRRAMIQSMVDGLSGRLATQGGPVEDWARLITSLGVLGDRAQAKTIYSEAQAAFAGRPTELAALKGAATSAGIAE